MLGIHDDNITYVLLGIYIIHRSICESYIPKYKVRMCNYIKKKKTIKLLRVFYE